MFMESANQSFLVLDWDGKIYYLKNMMEILRMFYHTGDYYVNFKFLFYSLYKHDAQKETAKIKYDVLAF